MCESTIIVQNEETREELMKDVIKVRVKDDVLTLIDITGDRKELSDMKIIEIDSLKHEIILTRK